MLTNKHTSFFILLLVLVASCMPTYNGEDITENTDRANNTNFTEQKNKDPYKLEKHQYKIFLDSFHSSKHDTSAIEMKAEAFKFAYNNSRQHCYGTSAKGYQLLDINYDGHKDLLLLHQPISLIGFGVDVGIYLYNPNEKRFENNVYQFFSNPSFYLEDKEITDFYIALGGGYGSLYKWRNGKWEKIKQYNFGERNEKGWKIEIINTETNDTSYTYQKSNFTIPDSKILRNKYNETPINFTF